MSTQFNMGEDSMLRVLSAARRPTNTWGDVHREWEFLCASMPELSLRPRSWKELHNRLTWLQIRDRRRHTKLLLGQAELLQQQTLLQLDSGPEEDISSDRDAANLHDGIAEGDFEDDGVDHGVPDEGALDSADGGGHSNADATVHMCSVCQESIDPGQELALPCACRKVSPCAGHFCCSCMQTYVATRLEGLQNTGIMHFPLPMLPISSTAAICGHHCPLSEVCLGPAHAKAPRARGIGPDADEWRA